MPATSTTAALMERLRNYYDAIHPYATQSIRIHAQRLARGTMFPGMTAEDHQQQLALDLWRRLPAYDPERAGLATFIDRTVRRRACDLIAAAQTATRRRERQTMSFDSADDGAGLADRLSTADGLWAGTGDLEREISLRHDLGRFVASFAPRPQALLRNPDERLNWRSGADGAVAPLFVLRGA